jgi:hypothetical protein
MSVIYVIKRGIKKPMKGKNVDNFSEFVLKTSLESILKQLSKTDEGHWFVKKTVKVNGMSIPANKLIRLLYEQATKEDITDKVPIHTCGNRYCVNPEHIKYVPFNERVKYYNRCVSERVTKKPAMGPKAAVTFLAAVPPRFLGLVTEYLNSAILEDLSNSIIDNDFTKAQNLLDLLAEINAEPYLQPHAEDV